jgi:hypothetical protein
MPTPSTGRAMSSVPYLDVYMFFYVTSYQVIPNVFRSQSMYERVEKEIQHHHPYMSLLFSPIVYSSYSDEEGIDTRTVSTIQLILVHIFIFGMLSIFYTLQSPPDMDICLSQTSPTSCFQQVSFFDASHATCHWKTQCLYSRASPFTYQAVVIIAVITSVLTAVFNHFLQFLLNILLSPTTRNRKIMPAEMSLRVAPSSSHGSSAGADAIPDITRLIPVHTLASRNRAEHTVQMLVTANMDASLKGKAHARSSRRDGARSASEGNDIGARYHGVNGTNWTTPRTAVVVDDDMDPQRVFRRELFNHRRGLEVLLRRPLRTDMLPKTSLKTCTLFFLHPFCHQGFAADQLRQGVGHKFAFRYLCSLGGAAQHMVEEGTGDKHFVHEGDCALSQRRQRLLGQVETSHPGERGW